MISDRTSTARLSADTAPAIEARQLAIWRSLSAAEVAAIVAGASGAVRALAIAGLRARFPEAGSRELTMRFAALTLGRELACRAYPELAAMGE